MPCDHAGAMTAGRQRGFTSAPGAGALRALTNVGTRAARTTLSPVVNVAAAAVKLERGSRAALGEVVTRALLARLDAALSSSYADEVVQHVLAAPVVERAVGVALRGRLVDVVARDAAHYAVLDRVVSEMLDTRALGDMLRGQGAEQLVAAVFDSGLLEDLITGLLASDELWRLIDEVAGSPAVTAAITQQGFGFVDQVADDVRRRSRNADGWLERTARRVARRPPPALPPDDQSAGEAP